LKYDVLMIFEEIYEVVKNRDAIHKFFSAEETSISPKTRKKALELISMYQL